MKLLLCTLVGLFVILLSLIVKLIAKNNKITFSKFVCLVICIAFINLSLASFLMAILGILTKFYFSLLLGIENIIFIVIIVKCKNNLKRKTLVFDFKVDLFFLCVIILALFVLKNQTQYLWGGRDPGLYLLKAANIGQEGGVILDSNDIWNENAEEYSKFALPEYRGIYTEYDGVNVKSLCTQFLDYTSAFLAIGYLIAGVHGIWIFNTVIGVVSIAMLFLYCSCAFSKKIAMMAVVLFLLNPAFIWNARITQSEITFLVIWLAGCTLFYMAWREKKSVLFIAFGAITGCLGFIRIDACLIWIGLLVLLFYVCLYNKLDRKHVFYIIFSFMIVGGLSVLYAYFFSHQYWIEHWEKGVLSSALLLTIFLFIAVILIIISKRHLDKKNDIIAIICRKDYLKIVLWVLFFLIHICYVVRPLLQNGENADWDFSQRSLKEFGWYVSVCIIPFYFAGLYTICKERKIRNETLFFILTGLSNLVIYLYQPGIAPDHFWASRRWIATCIPFVIIIGAVGIEACLKKIYMNYRQYLIYMALVLGGMCCIYLYNSRLFLNITMMKEMEGQYQELINAMDDEQVYFAQMSHYSSILRFVYGMNVFVLKENSGQEIAEYTENNESYIYLIGDENILDDKNLEYEKIYSGEIRGTWIKQTIGSYPSELEKTGGTTNIYKVWSKNIEIERR